MILEIGVGKKRREEIAREEVLGGFGLSEAYWVVSSVPKTHSGSHNSCNLITFGVESECERKKKNYNEKDRVFSVKCIVGIHHMNKMQNLHHWKIV